MKVIYEIKKQLMIENSEKYILRNTKFYIIYINNIIKMVINIIRFIYFDFNNKKDIVIDKDVYVDNNNNNKVYNYFIIINNNNDCFEKISS